MHVAEKEGGVTTTLGCFLRLCVGLWLGAKLQKTTGDMGKLEMHAENLGNGDRVVSTKVGGVVSYVVHDLLPGLPSPPPPLPPSFTPESM